MYRYLMWRPTYSNFYYYVYLYRYCNNETYRQWYIGGCINLNNQSN